MNVRTPAVAGQFYPNDTERLKDMMVDFFSKSPTEKEDAHGIVVPHAGLVYSGATAAKAYSLVPQRKKIIVIGPNHTVYTRGIVIDPHDAWESPLGTVPIDDLGLDFNKDSLPHEKEHSIEVQMPFLQHIFDDFTLTPIIAGDINDLSSTNAANKLNDVIDGDTLLVISTDLSHFYPLAMAENLDKETIKTLKELDLSGMIDACGVKPLEIAIKLCTKNGWNMNLVDYSTSAEASGDESSVVGYASFWF